MEYVDLLGALTAQNAPMLGTWNAAGSRTAGFRDLRLVYDPRLQAGLAPPGWPRTGWAGVLTARAVLAGQGTDLR